MKSFLSTIFATALLASSAMAAPQLPPPGTNALSPHPNTEMLNRPSAPGGPTSLSPCSGCDSRQHCCITKEDLRLYGQNNASPKCTYDECA
ncbi:hypothetical protein HIM_07845 [Hirsutella minnesotensis 3608]|uniref:Uncharacterized protein n=1 Tax=Hirsutella minnesotensis 3608 TaxID=1043627 RepID=A0A0F7ZMX7_9HYPO|nr:hypothetical protein HIM_07845 [Hirsutella minnesotensis 3608]